MLHRRIARELPFQFDPLLCKQGCSTSKSLLRMRLRLTHHPWPAPTVLQKILAYTFQLSQDCSAIFEGRIRSGIHCQGAPMPHIRYTIEVDCENTEPDRVIPAINGQIFEFVGHTDREVEIGSIHAYLVQAGRALDIGESLFDAMDSIDQSVHECYAALFDLDGDEWSESVRALYRDNVTAMDVLFIESIELKAEFAST